VASLAGAVAVRGLGVVAASSPSAAQNGAVVSLQPQPWPQIPEATARAARAAARRGEYPLAMRIRDELGELYADAEFAEAFGARGRPGWSPGRLALVLALQKVENLTDRAAAHRVRYGLDWKYALSLELDDEGFDPTVLSDFRAKLAEHGLEEKALDLLLAALERKGAARPGGQAAHRLCPRGRRGARAQPAGAGRGVRPRRA
jgi:transposase